MFESLRARLFGSHLLVGALVLFLSAASLFLLLNGTPTVDRFVYQRLETILRVVMEPGGRFRGDAGTRPSLDRALNVLGRPLDARAVVFGPGGELRFDSQPGLEPLPHDAIPARGSVAEPARGLYEDGSGGTWLIAATQVGGNGLLAVAAPRPSVRTFASVLGEALPPLVQAGVVALLASLLLVFLVARWVSGPLHDLGSAARSVAAAELEPVSQESGPREVREVVAAFNEMVAKVRASRRAQRDFVANVSHELKTPLTSIQGYAQAILDGTASEPDQQKRAARVIHTESVRLRRLIDDLLNLARIDAGQLELNTEPTDVAALVRSVVEQLGTNADRKGVHIVTSLPELRRIPADGDRLRQVFLNLLANAIDHSPQGGRVDLSAEVMEGHLHVHVVDSGPGITPEEQPRVFERFYQTDRARASSPEHGAGLGLSIADELVETHGGTIQVDSRPGEGARFTVVLPLGRQNDPTLAHQDR